MDQCKNCGAPIISTSRSSSNECQYCGQLLSKGIDSIFLYKFTINTWIGFANLIETTLKVIGTTTGKASRSSFAKSKNIYSYNLSNLKVGFSNIRKRRNVRFILNIISLVIISFTLVFIYNKYFSAGFSNWLDNFNHQISKKNKVSFDDGRKCLNSNLSIQTISQRTRAGVVQVFSDEASGSGFVVKHLNNKTLVLTNSHVVDGSKEVLVRWDSGQEDIANIVMDAGNKTILTDLALLEIKGKEGKVLILKESDIQVGSDVIAVGAPKGFSRTLTRGIVSSIRDKGKIIQHDATNNEGNSGGPLIDRSGCVIGVNTFGMYRNEGAVGLNFAISSLTAKRFLEKYSVDKADNKQANIVNPKSISPEKKALKYINKVRSIYKLKGKENESLKLIQNSLSLHQSSQAYMYKGYINSSLGKTKEAIDDFANAIYLDANWGKDKQSTLSSAYYSRAYQQLILKNNNAALEDFTEAISINSNNSDYFNGRCLAKNNLNDYRGAIIDCEYSIKLNPKHFYSYNNLGNAKRALQNYNGAIIAYTKQLRVNPSSTWANYNRGIAYELNGDINSACYDWKTASEIHAHKDAGQWFTRKCESSGEIENQKSINSSNDMNSSFYVSPLLKEELRKCNGSMSLFCKNLRRGKFKLKK